VCVYAGGSGLWFPIYTMRLGFVGVCVQEALGFGFPSTQ
jgi:hypothetical protein